MDSPSPSQPPPPPAHALDYSSPKLGGMVLLARFGTSEEAELHAGELEAEGIPTRVLNSHVNALGIPYSGLSDVELHVWSGDQARAAEILKHASGDHLEPAPEGGLAEPAVDEDGKAVSVVPLAAFESVRLMREAQTMLASAQLASYPPRLIPRGDRPAGTGKRFVLSVAKDDLERAEFLLHQAEGDADEELPRCPKCSSWRLYPIGHFLQSLAATFGLGPKPPEELECLACHHRGPSADFARSQH